MIIHRISNRLPSAVLILLQLNTTDMVMKLCPTGLSTAPEVSCPWSDGPGTPLCGGFRRHAIGLCVHVSLRVQFPLFHQLWLWSPQLQQCHQHLWQTLCLPHPASSRIGTDGCLLNTPGIHGGRICHGVVMTDGLTRSMTVLPLRLSQSHLWEW